MHDQILHYEVMETDFKALEKEVKYLKQEKDQQLSSMRQKINDK